MVKNKLDNRSLASKIAIREWLLARMRFEDVTVLDVCSGHGHIWSAMKDRVRIRQWTRTDRQPRGPHVLTLDAVSAIARFNLDGYNVIDIDPYGEPWEAYLVALQRITRPTAFFLTHGHVMMGGRISALTLKTVGIKPDWPIPRTPTLDAFVGDLMLRQTWKHATILHAGKIDYGGSRVTYYALGVEPLKQTTT
jgi:hypothetical protein